MSSVMMERAQTVLDALRPANSKTAETALSVMARPVTTQTNLLTAMPTVPPLLVEMACSIPLLEKSVKMAIAKTAMAVLQLAKSRLAILVAVAPLAQIARL